MHYFIERTFNDLTNLGLRIILRWRATSAMVNYLVFTSWIDYKTSRFKIEVPLVWRLLASTDDVKVDQLS